MHLRFIFIHPTIDAVATIKKEALEGNNPTLTKTWFS